MCKRTLSLPSRECGLKLSDGRVNVDYIGSLPSRECGLKSQGKELLALAVLGHSLRGSVD